MSDEWMETLAKKDFEKELKNFLSSPKLSEKTYESLSVIYNPSCPSVIDLMKLAYEKNVLEVWLFFGRAGSAKSTLACHLLYQVYRDWEKVLEHVVFNMQQLETLLYRKYADKGKRCWALLFDDAGIHLSSLEWQKPENIAFTAAFQGYREYVNVFMYTTIEGHRVLKILRENLSGYFKLPDIEFWGDQLVYFPRDHALFYLIERRANYKKPGQLWKRPVPYAYITFPALPTDFYEKYRMKKLKAIRTKDLEWQALQFRTKKAVKQIDEKLMPWERNLLYVLYDPADNVAMTIREIAEKLEKKYGKKKPIPVIRSSLETLESHKLVTSDVTMDGHTLYMLTKGGRAYVEFKLAEEEEEIEQAFPT